MAEPDNFSEPLPTQLWSGPPTSPSPVTAGQSSSAGPPRKGWQPPEPAHLQASFPQYEIRGVLGRGGMGAVYQGWQKSLDRLVAIKILPPDLEDNGANFAERFQREAKAMARFSHPGIVAVYDAGETPDGLFYFVMEHIEGTDVQKMVRENGPLPPEHALAITAHVCDALAYAHKRGVIHRDIKPANIMVDAEGQVKVADFGLAKVANDDSAALVTGTHVSMGTADFMAPEALYGMGTVDHRADLYAVGVMLYQMLTGEVPRGLFDMPSKHREGIDPRFDEIVKRAMQKDPEKRYASATEIRTDLDKILSEPVPHRSVVAPPPPAERGDSLPAPLGQQKVSDSEAWGSWLPAQASAKPRTDSPELPIPSKARPVAKAGQSATCSKRWIWLTSGVIATLLIFAGGAAFFRDQEKAEPVDSTPPDEIERIKQMIPPLAVAPAGEPSSIHTFAGHRYQFVPGSVTWEDAKTKAEAMGGHLATITSSEENTWVQTTFAAQFEGQQRSASLWIGGTAQASGQPWRWVTGEPFDFTDWSKGEPNFNSTAGRPLKGPFAIVLRRHGQLYWFSDPLDRKNVSLGFLVEWDDAGTPRGVESVAPAAATKDAPFTNSLGMKFVPVPITGGPTDGQRVLFSVWETRVQDFAAFATETTRKWAKPPFEQEPTHPAVMIMWEDAQAFCRWLTQRDHTSGRIGENQRYRLPSDHEWSCAVGLGTREDVAKTPAAKDSKMVDHYPWGTTWPPAPSAGNFSGEETTEVARVPSQTVMAGRRDRFPYTAPVGSFGSQSLGLMDLGGNVWEWCEDWFDGSRATRAVRGGSWRNGEREYLLSSCRVRNAANFSDANIGFRVVLAPVP